MEKRNSQCEHGQPMKQRRVLFCCVPLRCSSLSITTPVSLLAYEFNVLSILHMQVSLGAVNQIYVFHEVMNCCKKSKDSFKACFENVNMISLTLL